MLSTFLCTCWAIHISSLEKHIFSSFTHAHFKIVLFGLGLFSSFLVVFFFFVAIELMSSLYILDINPLSDIRFANIFFHCIRCLFTLLVSLLCRSLLFLCSTTYFWFCCSCFEYAFQKFITKTHAKDLFPMFSFRSFMVFGLTLKSLIHVKLISVRGVRRGRQSVFNNKPFKGFQCTTKLESHWLNRLLTAARPGAATDPNAAFLDLGQSECSLLWGQHQTKNARSIGKVLPL